MIAFIISTTIHEFCHAWSAYQLGDPTAAQMGRITLNPAAHFDPIGFIGMMLLAAGYTAIGWGKPVPVNTNLIRGHRKGLAITAAAGPLSNLVLATLFVIPLRANGDQIHGFGHVMLERMVVVNLLLAAFNLIPIPPLDGSKILAGLLPNFWYPYMARLEQYGFIILLFMFFIGGAMLGDMYRPVYDLLQSHIVGSNLF
jgi:Zn-dependent protease